jgi:hypothetical protein
MLRNRCPTSAETGVRLGPKYAPCGQPHFLNKEHLVALIRLFALGESEAFMCRCVFDQLADAARQRTWQARELLTATILEAIMRNVYHEPFKPGPSWDVGEPVRRYCRTQLGEAWLPTAERVLETQKRLRHRNAHPDWSLEEGGPAAKSQVEAAVDDLIFLSRFYGYVILSMAGLRDLKPDFPPPHSEWPPLATIAFQP